MLRKYPCNRQLPFHSSDKGRVQMLNYSPVLSKVWVMSSSTVGCDLGLPAHPLTSLAPNRNHSRSPIIYPNLQKPEMAWQPTMQAPSASEVSVSRFQFLEATSSSFPKNCLRFAETCTVGCKAMSNAINEKGHIKRLDIDFR